MKCKNDEALNRIREKHGNKYQYPNFKFEGTKKKIDVVCLKHRTISDYVWVTCL